MSGNQIRFDDGAAYEYYMGHWSQSVGTIFLNWLAPQPNLRWLDVGCGNGAFTELIVDSCQPASVHGIDPSEGQLLFARERPAARVAQFSLGDAMALPFAENTFDVTVMPLVIFFVPDPLTGIKEMQRVTRPGGVVCAYAWDMYGGGFPYNALQVEMRNMGIQVAGPPSAEASKIDTMRGLWAKVGLQDIETREIVVQRTFNSFDDYWSIILGGPSVAAKLAAMSTEDKATLTTALCQRLPIDANGHITYSAKANAIQGKVAG